MSLKIIINEFRKNQDSESFSKLINKLFDMHNNNESLGIFVKFDAKGNVSSFLTRSIREKIYIPIFTEDADEINNIIHEKKDFVLAMVKIPALFQLLLNQRNVDGFVLNDGEGSADVLFPKNFLEEILESQ